MSLLAQEMCQQSPRRSQGTRSTSGTENQCPCSASPSQLSSPKGSLLQPLIIKKNISLGPVLSLSLSLSLPPSPSPGVQHLSEGELIIKFLIYLMFKNLIWCWNIACYKCLNTNISNLNTIQDKTNASASFGKSYLILAPADNWLESKELMGPPNHPNHKPVLQGTYSWDHFSLSS